MKDEIYVPDSRSAAGKCMRSSLATPVAMLSKTEFVRVWCSLAYLFPGLHPDGYECADSGWPPRLRRFAADAWRRADAGELSDELLYPCDAQWAGICDRLTWLTREESERRTRLAVEFGDNANG